MNAILKAVERFDHDYLDGTLRRQARNAERMHAVQSTVGMGVGRRILIAGRRERRLSSADFLRPPHPARFIGGTTGRSGTTWLVRLLKAQFRSQPVVVDEIGVFVLSLMRHAPYEYYQLGTDGSVDRRHRYLDYFLNQVHAYAFKRRSMYGGGMRGLIDYIPRRAIDLAGDALKRDLPELSDLRSVTERFGAFYTHLINYHAAVVHGGFSDWINKEPPYGRHADELLAMVPTAKLVVMARDGRPTALSMYKRRWMRSVRACMDRWGEFAGMTLRAIRNAPSDRVLLVPYGEMVHEFESTVDQIHRFLELPAPDFDRLYREDRGRLRPEPESLDRWKQEIDIADIDYFDDTYGELMTALGLPQ